LVGIGVVVLLFVFWFALGGKSEKKAAIYTTSKIGTFKVDVATTGELRAKNSTKIEGPEGMRELRIFNVNIQRLVDEGTVVQKGDFVAELDRSEVSSSLQDAQLELEEVESNLETAKLDSSLSLSKARDNLISLEYGVEQAEIAVEQSQYESPATQRKVKIELDQANRKLERARQSYETEVRKAEVNIRRIEHNLAKKRRELDKIKKLGEKFTIYAPEDGMVIYKRNRDGSKLTEGSSVSAWDPVVAKLPDFSVMNSVTYVNEVDIRKIQVGQNVDVTLDAMPDKELTGEVTEIANIGEKRPNSDSKVFRVVVEINEADDALRPAMTTSNTIHINTVDSALYVPLETIHAQDTLNYVFKREGLEPVMQQVVLGLMNDNDVIIKAGLERGDRLYLSTPEDTTDISKRKLDEAVVKKYEQEAKKDSARIMGESDEQQPTREAPSPLHQDTTQDTVETLQK